MDDIDKIVHWLGHASFRLEIPDGRALYIDPYLIEGAPKKADILLITHPHADHFSPADMDKVTTEKTRIFGPESLAGKVKGLFTALKPGDTMNADGIGIEAVSAYNVDKNFHPKAAGNLGYVVTIGDLRVYHAGDTDVIPEMRDVHADVALLPVGGTYTMDAAAACEAARLMKCRVAIPMHYGTVVGDQEDALRFKNLSLCEARRLKKEK